MPNAKTMTIQANSATEEHSHKFCTMKRVLALEVLHTFRIEEMPKNRINIGDFRCMQDRLHNFRITRLWTGCTRLIERYLENGDFD
jgi:hypothetical protein